MARTARYVLPLTHGQISKITYLANKTNRTDVGLMLYAVDLMEWLLEKTAKYGTKLTTESGVVLDIDTLYAP